MRKLILFCGLLLALGLIYSPALIADYGHQDDYLIWGVNGAGDSPDVKTYILSGRFLGAILWQIYFPPINNIGDLKALRFLSLVYISFCAFICFFWLTKYLKNNGAAFLCVIMIFTLAPYQSLISWASSVVVATAVFVVCLAGLAAEKSLFFRRINPFSCLAVGLLLCSLLIYQPAGMFYWVVAILILLSLKDLGFKDLKERTCRLFGIGLCSVMLYAGVLSFTKIFYGHVPFVQGAYTPYKIEANYLEKLSWFFYEPFFNALNLWSIFPGLTFAWCVAVILTATYLRFIFHFEQEHRLKSGLQRCLRLLGWVAIPAALLVLSYLPNLVATYKTPWYLCSVALAPMVLIGLLLSLQYWCSFLPQAGRTIVPTVVLILTCLWAARQANVNIYQYRIIPDRMELEYATRIFRKSDFTAYKRIFLIKPDENVFAPHVRYHEFGRPASAYTHHTMGFLRCAFNEMGIQSVILKENPSFLRCQVNYPGSARTYDHYYSVFFSDWPILAEEKDLVIDMNKIKGF